MCCLYPYVTFDKMQKIPTKEAINEYSQPHPQDAFATLNQNALSNLSPCLVILNLIHSMPVKPSHKSHNEAGFQITQNDNGRALYILPNFK